MVVGGGWGLFLFEMAVGSSAGENDVHTNVRLKGTARISTKVQGNA